MWLWLGLVSAQVLLVLWLGSEHELARALELQEQLLSGAASQLARVVDAVEEGLSPEKIEHLGAFLREDPLFGVVIDESGGRHRCWPSGLSAVADQVDAMLPADRGWAFVEEGAWAERGVLALRVTRAGRQGVLLLELPRLLVSAYQPSAAGEALILWVTGSGEEPRFFFASPDSTLPGGGLAPFAGKRSGARVSLLLTKGRCGLPRAHRWARGCGWRAKVSLWAFLFPARA